MKSLTFEPRPPQTPDPKIQKVWWINFKEEVESLHDQHKNEKKPKSLKKMQNKTVQEQVRLMYSGTCMLCLFFIKKAVKFYKTHVAYFKEQT